MAGSGRAIRALGANRDLVRVCLAFLNFVLAEYAVWIAMLVYAYDRGGASTAGLIALAQLAPGVVLAPFLSTITDRSSPTALLKWGYLAQAGAMAATAAVLYSHGPALAAYAGAIVAATAVTTTRPAQAALTPTLARSANELSALNAALGWLENVGIMVCGALTGLALSGGQPGLVFAAGAGCASVAAVLIASLATPQADEAMPGDAIPGDDAGEAPSSAWADVRNGAALLRNHRESRLLVSLIGAEYIVIGAFDLLVVVLAISVLDRGAQWSGYLNTAYGVGGVAAGVVTVALLGRRLSLPIIVAATGICVALSATAFSHSPALTLVLLACVGLSRAVLDTAAITLLQRTVPPDFLGRIFGMVEGLSSAGLAVGALLVPLLTKLGGTTTALIGAAVLIPLALIVSGRTIASVDAAARMPVVEVALLRAMPHFRVLPAPALEGLAQALVRTPFADGQTIIAQGEVGDTFYAIAEGRVDIWIDGEYLGSRGRPEGLGEIALLRQVPRTATVIASGDVVLYALDGNRFLTVVTGHEPTARRSEAVAEARVSDACGANNDLSDACGANNDVSDACGANNDVSDACGANNENRPGRQASFESTTGPTDVSGHEAAQ